MGKYEMSHHLCGFFDAAVEDGQWVKALEYARTAVTTRRYPQARVLRDIMSKILMVSDSQYFLLLAFCEKEKHCGISSKMSCLEHHD